ncbi:ionotropic receptor 93a isoform X1 [Onthophagus taurus]|uniref:ionotropic receptor 93a isoform X1 n=2 Tax=Onthophagus taurus TaxID=166361 RepID=UPI0039BE6865
MLSLTFLMILTFPSTFGNNFPSLLTTNATLAVILDKEYLGDDYANIKDVVETYVGFIKREKLKNGGLNVIFYSWTSIKIKKDFSAILSVASCSDTWRLFDVARNEHVLFMAISESDCPRLPQDLAFTIPLIMQGQELPQIILDLRSNKAYNWNSVTVLYDLTLSRDMITRVLTSLTLDNVDIAATASTIALMELTQNYSSIYNIHYVREVLTSLKWRNIGTNYLVMISIELVPLVMDISKNLKLVNTESQWLYIISNADLKNETNLDVIKHLKEGDNVAFVYNVTSSEENCKQGIQCHIEEVLDAFSRALESAILDEIDLAGQVSDEEWEAIRPTKSERRNFLLKSMKSYLSQNGECDNCTIWQMKAGDTWGREFLRNSSVLSVELLQVGYWKPREGPLMTDVLFPHVTHGFRGRRLSLAVVHNPPWQVIEVNNSSVTFRGMVADIVNELSKNLNFSYAVIPIGNTSSSKLNSDYDFNDISTYEIPDVIINLVRTRKVLMAASAFTISEKTKTLVNFTLPISTQTYTILAARPKELSRALLFMSPFTQSTWLSLLTAILLMGPILYLMNKFTPVYEYNGISVKGLSSIYNCIWYVYGALLQQGGMYLPYADSARIIIGSWWLVVLVLSTTYCGNLVAFLTFPNSDKPISTIEDVLNHPSLTWTIAQNSFFEEEAKTSNDPKYQELFKKSIKASINKQNMVQNIENGHHVYIDWKMRLQYMMKKQFLLKNTCGLALGKEEFCEERIGLILAKDNPYTEKINKEIKRLHQVGLIQKWLRDYLPKRDRCYKSRSTSAANNHTVNLDDMQGSFFVLFFGFLIGLFIIFVEKLLYKYQKKRSKSKSVQPFIT